MSKAYCVLSIDKVHTFGGLHRRQKHNLRELPYEHIDESKTCFNKELVNHSGMDYQDLWHHRIHELEMETGQSIAVRKNSVLAYEMVATFSREADIDLDAWVDANIKWFNEKFGEENVLSVQLHMDETTPHLHAIVMPIDERGHLCAKSITGGRSKMRKLQSSYGEAMSAVGLERGEMFSRSKKKHLNRFYGELNKAATAEVPEILPEENVDDYLSRVNRYVQDLKMETLWNEQDSQRKVEVAYTREAQMYHKYKHAMKLQNELTEQFNGDEDMAIERINTYRSIEKAVPRKTLKGLLESILKKFPIQQNIFASVKDKIDNKKKHLYKGYKDEEAEL